MRLAAVVLALVLMLAACGGDDDMSGPPTTTVSQGGTTTTEESPPTSTEEEEDGEGGSQTGPVVLIETGTDAVEVPVEVADSPGEREVGLMHRESLPEDAGMVFLFEEDNVGGFWMKNTLIPLSIAFYAGDGRIVKILDMEPCREDPCPLYYPGVPYRGALEVNQGAFDRWNVAEGDRVRLER
jgi:uncharacterized protein